jgi:hypothetical protein
MNEISVNPKSLVLIEMNEINFDLVQKYIAKDSSALPSFQKLLRSCKTLTVAEDSYPNIEPWIQWVSVHTGLTYAEHNIFRLGDIVGSGVPQIYELLEQSNLRVGCISPMNAENRLADAAYFIPDAWTQTQPDSSWWSRRLHKAICQVVNDNAKKHVSLGSIISLVAALARFAQPKNYGLYLSLLKGAAKSSWYKALLLDLLLHDLHVSLLRSKAPDFSSVFLNAGAHIQHHYFLMSEAIQDEISIRNPSWYSPAGTDPVYVMLTVYDRILCDYLSNNDREYIVATGLSQVPFNYVKYYYRLKRHEMFLRELGLNFTQVYPRMTRDFLIEFSDRTSAVNGINLLRGIKHENTEVPIFGEIEDRGCSAFVTLTYPYEITADTVIVSGSTKRNFYSDVAFVALKNGMHSSDGYAFFSPGIAKYAPNGGEQVGRLYSTIRDYFLLN